ncbi:hypothetical protein M5D96_011712 [Drosophila gunungcola]|uniref:Uncharacterized protein n=1 Tax=Drosophila gunungcola TaxID=103775 RepID=A0A9P9YF95_9MUSC|nr:hypothetical protein M5D96_011712 [Drosophila gunungcola]
MSCSIAFWPDQTRPDQTRPANSKQLTGNSQQETGNGQGPGFLVGIQLGIGQPNSLATGDLAIADAQIEAAIVNTSIIATTGKGLSYTRYFEQFFTP